MGRDRVYGWAALWPALHSALYFALLIAAYYQVKPLTRTLYITALGSDNLPYIWLGTVVVLGALIPLFHRLVRRWSSSMILSRLSCSLLLFLAICRLAYVPESAPFAVAFYLLVDVYSVVLVESFWSMTNSYFKREGGKRWYGLIASGGLLGGMLGSFWASALLRVPGVGSPELIISSFVLLGLSLLLLPGIKGGRAGPADADANPAAAAAAVRPDLGIVLREPYFRLILLLLVLAQLVQPLVEFVFLRWVEQGIVDLDSRTLYLSQVFTVLSGAALAVNLAVLPLAHRLAGVVGGLLLQPLLLLLVGAFFLMQPALWLITALKIVDRGLAYSSGRASRELLYLGLPSSTIFAVKAQIDVFGYRFFKLFGGVVVWLYVALGGGDNAHYLVWGVLLLALLWLGVIGRMRNFIKGAEDPAPAEQSDKHAKP